MAAAGGPGGGGDSGVETECESNDSSLSSFSLGGGPSSGPAPPALHQQHSLHSSPPEDGYLGDCSSDGGNEKNFPLPADWGPPGCPSRLSLPPSPLQADQAGEEVEPPAGLQFGSVAQQGGEGPGLGYQLLPRAAQDCWSHQANLKTKMRAGRTTGLRSRYNHQVGEDWGRVKTAIAERKLRTAANTNNTELVERLLASSPPVSPNSSDEHKRSALHFAAAKVSFLCS